MNITIKLYKSLLNFIEDATFILHQSDRSQFANLTRTQIFEIKTSECFVTLIPRRGMRAFGLSEFNEVTKAKSPSTAWSLVALDVEEGWRRGVEGRIFEGGFARQWFIKKHLFKSSPFQIRQPIRPRRLCHSDI